MTKKIVLFFVVLFLNQLLFGQKIFFNDTLYHYSLGTQEPDSKWIDTTFDDSGWLIGHKNIGYGNSSDSTKIPTNTKSLYIRYPFTVDTAKYIKEASLTCDYDDGFVAYLNGIEILRVNLGKSGSPTSCNQLADRSHELIDKRGINPLRGYYIDSVLLHKALKNGKNILSVEVHNDSISGSDLGFNCYLYNLTNRPVTPYDFPWHVKKSVSLDSSFLPIINITTNEMGVETDTGKVSGKMYIYRNTNGKVNKTSDFPELICNIGIKIRGNSTKDWPKKNYTLETQDYSGQNFNVPLLGLPAENDWVLNGPFADKSQIRNVLSFSLGQAIMDGWTPHTRYCELILNGEFMGLYVLIETIKRDSNRIDIKKIKPSEISGNDLTGGYIFKMDQNGLETVYPKPEEIAPEQKKYISNIYYGFTGAAKSTTFLDSINGFKNKIDIKNFIDYTIVNEFTKNVDAYQYSFYMHKDRNDINDKLLFGPIWDFDLSFGNINAQNGQKSTGWQFAESSCWKMYQKSVFRDTFMVRMLRERWIDLRKTTLKEESLFQRIDSIYNSVSDPIKRNYEVWPFDGKVMDIWGYKHPAKTYNEDMNLMKTFITNRLTWIDGAVKTLYYAMPPATYADENIAMKNFIISYPNPCSSELNSNFIIDENKPYQFDIYTMMGQQVFSHKGISSGKNSITINTQEFRPGVYYIITSSNGEIIAKQTIIKQ